MASEMQTNDLTKAGIIQLQVLKKKVIHSQLVQIVFTWQDFLYFFFSLFLYFQNTSQESNRCILNYLCNTKYQLESAYIVSGSD